MQIQDEQPRAATILDWCKRITPNFPALLTLCALFLIWKALSPIWIPSLAWLFSLFEPGFFLLAKAFAVVAVLFIMVMCPILVLAAVALVLGGGLIRSTKSAS